MQLQRNPYHHASLPLTIHCFPCLKLSHMQTGVAGVEQRLGKKVMMSSKNRTGAAKHDLNATNSRYWNSGGGNKFNNTSRKEAEKEDGSDESEGRGAAIGKGKKRSSIGSMRADLLASGGSKKRKKKLRGGGGGG